MEPTSRERIQRLVNLLRMETKLHFEVSRFAPGDGWARYSLQVKSPDSSFEMVNSLNAKEMEKYLDGLYAGIRLRESK